MAREGSGPLLRSSPQAAASGTPFPAPTQVLAVPLGPCESLARAQDGTGGALSCGTGVSIPEDTVQVEQVSRRAAPLPATRDRGRPGGVPRSAWAPCGDLCDRAVTERLRCATVAQVTQIASSPREDAAVRAKDRAVFALMPPERLGMSV